MSTTVNTANQSLCLSLESFTLHAMKGANAEAPSVTQRYKIVCAARCRMPHLANLAETVSGQLLRFCLFVNSYMKPHWIVGAPVTSLT